ncbi:MAG: hypothetical protein OEN22_02365 [Gammaproteobacteria bacterium]|nr:hypothetical protein [Gammaproteobacteria bacterium]
MNAANRNVGETHARFAAPARTKRLILAAATSAVAAGLISGSHHWYGAVAYDTPWRLQVSYWIAAAPLVVVGLFYVYWKLVDRFAGRVALWLVFLTAVVLQTGFTLFECVYSHVLKNILYFGGAPQTILAWLYPAPAYHLPDNWLFELLGLLQLAGLVAAWYAFRVFQDRPWADQLKSSLDHFKRIN